MSQRATINPIKVPYTPVECPVCETEYKEHNPRKEVNEGHWWSKCPNGHVNAMGIREPNNTLIVRLTPLEDKSGIKKPNSNERATQ